MTRFDDFIKLLLGLLVAQIVKEHHQISHNLVLMFNNTGDKVAEVFPYSLLLLFLRNTHASINWDRIASDGKFATAMDRTIRGRAFVFIVTLISLVIVPLVILDTLTGHTSSSRGRDVLMWSLFAPFVLYFIWNALLFFSSEPKSNAQLFKVVMIWLRVDALAGVALGYLVMRYAYTKFFDSSAQSLYFLEAFMALSVATVFVDYFANREFYFGTGSTDSARPKCGPE
jgi:hypothetical protein